MQPVDDYLARLERALRQADVQQVQLALDDAREFLEDELERCARERGEKNSDALFAHVETRFGTPDEIARSYAELGPGQVSPIERLRARRFGYAPGWWARCVRCGRERPLVEAIPGAVRIGAWSWCKYWIGFCTQCRFPAIIRLVKRT